ncbi:MAG TPA: hypothetical protein VL742_20115 [Casimicrobiaceae bacterium]|nr:hypothetical protein [Casimicrobiaceae bacterium]
MCYEFSEWGWKARASELARKLREAEKAAKKESNPEPAPSRPEPRIEEREKEPA